MGQGSHPGTSQADRTLTQRITSNGEKATLVRGILYNDGIGIQLFATSDAPYKSWAVSSYLDDAHEEVVKNGAKAGQWFDVIFEHLRPMEH